MIGSLLSLCLYHPLFRGCHQHVVIEDLSVYPEWPVLMAERHGSAGESSYPDGVGLPTACAYDYRTALPSALGNLLRERSTCSSKAWWARE